jgi:hypothetical protein
MAKADERKILRQLLFNVNQRPIRIISYERDKHLICNCVIIAEVTGTVLGATASLSSALAEALACQFAVEWGIDAASKHPKEVPYERTDD